MNQEYAEIYRILYLQVPQEPISPRWYPFANYVPSMIDEVERAVGKTLRPDAKLFLATNINQMIVNPIMLGTDTIKQNELPKILQDDIRQIVQFAADKRMEREPQEQGEADRDSISSHDVINAINSLWRQLGTTIRDTWG